MAADEIKKYYDAHKQDFTRPEQVALAELFLSTDGKSPEEISAVRTRAEDLHNRLVKGEDFSVLAKRYSEGSTAQDGGDLGEFEHGQLAKSLEDAVFNLDKGQFTDVIQTKTGFEILKVIDHYQAGLQPLDKVEGEIQNVLYKQKMEPAMRDYLAQLREESYVQVKAGFTDTAAVAGGYRDSGSCAHAGHDGQEEGKEENQPSQNQRLMKSQFISALADGQIVTSLFLVREKRFARLRGRASPGSN